MHQVSIQEIPRDELEVSEVHDPVDSERARPHELHRNCCVQPFAKQDRNWIKHGIH